MEKSSFSILFIILIITFIVPVSQAQETETEESIFAYAKKEKGLRGTPRGTHYKEKVLQKVLDDLIEARGEKRMQAPELVMNNDELYVAWMDPKKVVIGMEEKAYDLCTTFGKDSLAAMAALLAHEVTHYYDKHDWSRHFAKENKELEAAQHIKAQEESLRNETQADYLGGFLGFTAGYNTLGVMPKMLDKVYAEYGLNAKLQGYPSLEERKAVAEKSMEKLADLMNVFEMANYMVVLEQYDDALAYYKYILKEFQSREMYNNAGVVLVLQALHLFDKKEVKFGYPVELDAESRLGSATRSAEFSNRVEKREKLLEEAIEQFEIALELDKEYPVAYLNIGCAYALLDDVEEASYHSRKATKLVKKSGTLKKLKADAFILQAILADKMGDTQATGDFLGAAIGMGSSLAQYNKNILDGKSVHNTKRVVTNNEYSEEEIEDVLLEDVLEELEVDKQIKIDRKVVLAIKNMEQSKILVHLVNGGEAYALVHMTNKDYEEESGEGVKINDDLETVIENYEAFARSLENPRGQFLVYPKTGIFFVMNEQSKVKQWGTYILEMGK